MTTEPGVYCIEPPDVTEPLHRFTEGDYGLTDIPELMLIGRTVTDPDGRERITLTAHELRELKTFADAHSFDFEEGLIELCNDLHSFASEHGASEFTFTSFE